MLVRRFDAFRLDAATPTPSGGLRIDAFPTRAGVLTYRDGDGTLRRELRHPDEVFHPDSLRSLRGAPLTDRHPEGAVTPESWKQHAIGHVSDQIDRTPDDRVFAPVLVQDANAIRAIQNGERKELSAGYMATVIPSTGEYNGEPYDYIQTGITYNHLALLGPGEGRAGPQCALRLDAKDAVAVQEEKMATLRIDGKDVPADTAQPTIDALIAERDSAKGAAAAALEDAKREKMRADAASDPKAIAALVATRVKLLSDIQRGNAFFLRDAEEEPAEPSAEADPIALMTEALSKWAPTVDVKGKSPEYIAGAFAVMLAKVVDEADEPDGDEAPTDSAYETPTMQQNGGNSPRADAAARKLTGNRKSTRIDADDEDEYTKNIRFQADRASKPLAVSKG